MPLHSHYCFWLIMYKWMPLQCLWLLMYTSLQMSTHVTTQWVLYAIKEQNNSTTFLTSLVQKLLAITYAFHTRPSKWGSYWKKTQYKYVCVVCRPVNQQHTTITESRDWLLIKITLAIVPYCTTLTMSCTTCIYCSNSNKRNYTLVCRLCLFL